MKKLLKLTVIATFGVVALTSCKKDWTCDCTASGADATEVNAVLNDPTATYTVYSDLSKSEAKSKCDSEGKSAEVSLKEIDMNVTLSCTPKAK